MDREKKIYQKIPPPKTPKKTIADLKSMAGRKGTEEDMRAMLEKMDLGHIVKKKGEPGQMRARHKYSLLEKAKKIIIDI